MTDLLKKSFSIGRPAPNAHYTIFFFFFCFCINLLFSPEGARVICWSSAGEANCGNMPKSGMFFIGAL